MHRHPFSWTRLFITSMVIVAISFSLSLLFLVLSKHNDHMVQQAIWQRDHQTKLFQNQP